MNLKEREYLEKILGGLFVDRLPLLAETFKHFRQGFGGGTAPSYAATRREILVSLRHVAAIAKQGDRAAVADAIECAAGPVRGWYLPWYVSCLIGPPDLQGMDPALVDAATPHEIAKAAHDAMEDPRLKKAGPRGRPPDLAVYKLIATVRMGYELHTGKCASFAGSSRFLRGLAIVAAYVGWVVAPDTLQEHASNVLRDKRWNQDWRFEPYFACVQLSPLQKGRRTL